MDSWWSAPAAAAANMRSRKLCRHWMNEVEKARSDWTAAFWRWGRDTEMSDSLVGSWSWAPGPPDSDLPPLLAWICSLSTIQDHALPLIYYLHYLFMSSSLTFACVCSFLHSGVWAAHMKKIQHFFSHTFWNEITGTIDGCDTHLKSILFKLQCYLIFFFFFYAK